MVSMGTNALASYIVLACRPRQLTAMQTDRRSFIVELRRELPAALRRLQQGNIAPVDFAQASIGPGMAIYSRYSQILESDGNAMTVRSALGIVNQTLSEVLSEQQDEFDPHTRWAVTWFDQNGFAEGEFGDAELLSKAKVTSVHGLQVAGLILSKAGKVRLLRPDELDVDWNPETKSQLTGWGIVHHLAQALQEGGELACAMMFAKLGNEGNAARELAYLLYSICERRKRTQEALPYNALVQSWPEIQRLAREQETRPAKPQQTTMFS
jgi:putative DNA methylase